VELAIEVPDRVCRTTPWSARYGADAPHPAPLDSDPLIRADFTDDCARHESAPRATSQVPGTRSGQLHGPHAVQVVIVDHRMRLVSRDDLANMAEVSDLLEWLWRVTPHWRSIILALNCSDVDQGTACETACDTTIRRARDTATVATDTLPDAAPLEALSVHLPYCTCTGLPDIPTP